MTKTLASVLDAFHAEEPYRGVRCRTDGTVIWHGRQAIAARAQSGRILILPETAACSLACQRTILAVRRAFPDSQISPALPLPRPQAAA